MAVSNDSRQAAYRARQKQYVAELEFFCAILLAVSEHRAQSLAVMEDFLAEWRKSGIA